MGEYCARMKPVLRKPASTKSFDAVKRIGLTLPGVEAVIRYDGSPTLKAGGCFMAALASHHSAEPDSLVIRMDLADRQALLEDAPETYYLTDYYERHPVVLARLSQLNSDALHDLLSVSRRLTLAKARKRPDKLA
jgi:hypothetical protein